MDSFAPGNGRRGVGGPTRGRLVTLGVAVMLLGLVMAVYSPSRETRKTECPAGYSLAGTRVVFDIIKSCPCVCEAIRPPETGDRSQPVPPTVLRDIDHRVPLRIVVFAIGMLAGLGLSIMGIRTKR
jgi:hypothetical protein